MRNIQTHCMLFFLISLLFGCSSAPEKPEAWEPQFDQVIASQTGGIDFGRTHYVIHKRRSMNDLRENQVRLFMKKVCKERKIRLIRKYMGESDFVSLKNQYALNVPIKVFEFQCR